jgi:quinolinate synthase
MKKITPEKVLWSLQEMVHRIVVPEPTCSRARKTLDRMLAVTRGEQDRKPVPAGSESSAAQ